MCTIWFQHRSHAIALLRAVKGNSIHKVNSCTTSGSLFCHAYPDNKISSVSNTNMLSRNSMAVTETLESSNVSSTDCNRKKAKNQLLFKISQPLLGVDMLYVTAFWNKTILPWVQSQGMSKQSLCSSQMLLFQVVFINPNPTTSIPRYAHIRGYLVSLLLGRFAFT